MTAPNATRSGEIDLHKLARLARLELTEQEQVDFGPQISAILGFVEQLSELDTTGIEPMTSALDVDNRFRDDAPGESLSSDVATRNAPAAEEGYFLVPAVLGTAANKR